MRVQPLLSGLPTEGISGRVALTELKVLQREMNGGILSTSVISRAYSDCLGIQIDKQNDLF
jgi:hypothetical protein